MSEIFPPFYDIMCASLTRIVYFAKNSSSSFYKSSRRLIFFARSPLHSLDFVYSIEKNVTIYILIVIYCSIYVTLRVWARLSQISKNKQLPQDAISADIVSQLLKPLFFVIDNYIIVTSLWCQLKVTIISAMIYLWKFWVSSMQIARF